jgi:hypothetical protein
VSGKLGISRTHIGMKSILTRIRRLRLKNSLILILLEDS